MTEIMETRKLRSNKDSDSESENKPAEEAGGIVALSKIEVNKIFIDVAKKLKEEGAIVIMPTFYPQEGIVLQELATLGVCTHTYGPGKTSFDKVEHTEVVGVASNVDSETPENIEKIINSIDLEDLRGKNIYIYQFMHYEWKDLLQKRINEYNTKNLGSKLNCAIIADMTMGHEQFFEGKHRLPDILKEAQLAQYKIPGTINDLVALKKDPLSEATIRDHFKIQQSEETGKIVVQFCGEGYQEVGGGQGTIIFDNYKDFEKAFKLFQISDTQEEAALTQDSTIKKFLVSARANEERGGVSLKISKYIQGIEGNLSFIVLPLYTTNQEMTKVVDIRGKKFTPAAKDGIVQQMQGLDSRNTVVVPGRMTLKCVGDHKLTTKSGSGVGNDLGYFYGEKINKQIMLVSQQLGKYMASCGHRGLAGCDIKITLEGQVYIIEINDRQQGPTAGMSQDAEGKGAPSLIKMQTIYAFGSLEQISEMQKAVRGEEKDIGETYMSQGGSFYIKFANIHEYATAHLELRPGYYALNIGKDRQWHWDLKHQIQKYNAEIQIKQNDILNSNRIVLGLKGCSFDENKIFGLDEQMVKIIGTTTEQFPGPFTANSAGTKVELQGGFWEQIIDDLRTQIEQGHYVENIQTIQEEFIELGKVQPQLNLEKGNYSDVRTLVIKGLVERTKIESQQLNDSKFVKQESARRIQMQLQMELQGELQ